MKEERESRVEEEKERRVEEEREKEIGNRAVLLCKDNPQ